MQPLKSQDLQEEPLIPEAKNDAVARALREAFGVSDADEIRKMTGGLSKALVFRIVVQGCPYLLRVIMDTGTSAGPGQGDQTHHFACMRVAAEAGIGPHVWYTSADDGISITDFVEARPFSRAEALALLPGIIRTLHALPPYPAPRVVNYLEGMDNLVRKFQAAGSVRDSEAAEVFEGYARVAGAYPRDNSDLVSSHNDLRPENILFDGERAWLVDWEAAFLNDRYVDLAVAANFIVTNSGEEEAYLQAYFGEGAGEYRRARFYLMNQLLHLFYPAFMMLFGCKGKSIDSIASAPDFRDFHQRLRAGEIDLADDKWKLEYAKVHMNEALQNMRTARFQEALRIVAAGG